MAVLQRAWLFEPGRTHDRIAAQVVAGDVIDTDRLVEVAGHVAAKIRAGGRSSGRYLDMVSYDDSWLAPDEESGELDVAGLYVVAMGASIETVEGVDRPHTVLRTLESGGGWTHEDARRAIGGDPLSTLPLPDDPLVRLVRADLGSLRFGGWLSQAASAELLSRLRDVPAGDADDGDGDGDSDGDGGRGDIAQVMAMHEALQQRPAGWALRCISD